MSKRKRKNTLARQENLAKAGRGKGKGASFKSYTEIHDIGSLGESTRSPSIKHGNQKIHHTLSRLETKVSLFALNPSVTDYRTQVVLDIEVTKAIASYLGLKHPQSHGLPAPMVCDVEVDLRGPASTTTTKAFTVKPSSKLNNKRTLEKFTIEKTYYDIKGIFWGIITEKDIPKIPTQNLAYLKPYFHLDQSEATIDQLVSLADFAKPHLDEASESLSSIARKADKEFNYSKGSTLKIFLHFIARGFWQIDFSIPLKVTDKKLKVHTTEELFLLIRS